MQQLAAARSTLHITHHYAASPVRVFDAWLAPQLAGLWLFATASRPMVNATIDARNGGSFSFVEYRAGTRIEHRGHYVEILRPQHLVFMLHSADCAAEGTRVSVSLRPLRKGCELQLHHDELPAARAAHVQARWEGMFYGLESVLAQSHAGETI